MYQRNNLVNENVVIKSSVIEQKKQNQKLHYSV